MEPFYHQSFFLFFFFSANLCSDSGSVKAFVSDVKQKEKWRRNIALNLERTATRGHPLVQFTFYVNHYVYIYYSILVMYTIISRKKKEKKELFFEFNWSNWWLTYTNPRTLTNLYLYSFFFIWYLSSCQ